MGCSTGATIDEARPTWLLDGWSVYGTYHSSARSDEVPRFNIQPSTQGLNLAQLVSSQLYIGTTFVLRLISNGLRLTHLDLAVRHIAGCVRRRSWTSPSGRTLPTAVIKCTTDQLMGFQL